MKTNNVITRIVGLLTVGLLIIGLLVVSLLGFTIYWQRSSLSRDINTQAKVEMSVENSPHFTQLWQKSDVKIRWNRDQSSRDMYAIGNGVFLVWGSENSPLDSPIAATLRRLNLYTGQIEWEAYEEINDRLAYNSTYLFAGAGYKRVVAFDLKTGDIAWSTPIDSRGFLHMTATETKLFIEGTPANSYILDANSGTIQHSEASYEGLPILHIENNIVYWQSLPLYLTAFKYDTKEPLWEMTFGDPYRATPIFTDKYILLTTRLGRLYVIEKETGNVVWEISEQSPDLLASHVAISNGKVFLLTENSELQVRSIDTGGLLGSLSFQPSLIEQDVDFANNTFNVAASDDVVVVYFGHSKQLFAFQFLPE